MGAVHSYHAPHSRPLCQLHVTTQEDPGGARNGSLNIRWYVVGYWSSASDIQLKKWQVWRLVWSSD